MAKKRGYTGRPLVWSELVKNIESLQNPQVKQVVRLRERRERDKKKLFLIEGYRELLRATQSDHPVETLFICPKLFLGTNEQNLIDTIVGRGAELIECTEPVFQKLSYRDRPDGLLAIAPQQHTSLDQLEIAKNPLLVVAEAIEKPGNLGTILRSSDASAVDALILADRCTDSFNPNVVRASVGTRFTVPLVEAGGDETLQWLKENKIQIVAATPNTELIYTDADLSGPIAIAVGTEQLGLSDQWLEQADIQVRIPMQGVADSLNVAMATTLLLYEALRQRN